MHSGRHYRGHVATGHQLGHPGLQHAPLQGKVVTHLGKDLLDVGLRTAQARANAALQGACTRALPCPKGIPAGTTQVAMASL
eukprot:gene4186-biopygen3985